MLASKYLNERYERSTSVPAPNIRRYLLYVELIETIPKQKKSKVKGFPKTFPEINIIL